MIEALETLDDLVLVLGKDTSETVGIQNHVGMAASRGRTGLQDLGGIQMAAQTETTSGIVRNGELITGDRLDLDAEREGSKMGRMPMSPEPLPSAS